MEAFVTVISSDSNPVPALFDVKFKVSLPSFVTLPSAMTSVPSVAVKVIWEEFCQLMKPCY